MSTDLERRLGYTFQDRERLQTALTHRSYFYEHKSKCKGHYERLEFLGDAVLDLILSETLMTRFPEVDEGVLSKWRASLVNETTLAEIAKALYLGQDLYLGKSEEQQRADMRARLLSSVLEAVIGAVYLDGGLDAARALISSQMDERIARLDREHEYAADFKTRLQEWSQKRYHTTPDYRLLSSEGPEHAKRFVFVVAVNGEQVGQGEGGSRKSAEQDAARSALEKLEGERK